LRRPVEAIGSEWPLYRVDHKGQVQMLGTLSALAAAQYHFAAAPPVRRQGFAWEGISNGIPYFLQDQRPGGFIGRAVPRKFPELRLPQRVIDWNDDHYLRYLTQRGADTLGDLVLGETALDGYLGLRRARTPVPSSRREALYPEFADEAMAGGLPGSSAHGEHPKFATMLQEGSASRHVLVKFSPRLDTPAGVRWSDLLVAEHLALSLLSEAGIAAAASQIFRFDDRTYLEVERFDRRGIEGRVGVTSLWAIDACFYGQLDNWLAAAGRLLRDRRITVDGLEQIRLVTAFGALIANTDRHFGNLSFFDDYSGGFTLAPVYDMLPMLFAPEHDQVIPREFVPPDATAETLAAYSRAAELALMYWRRVAADDRVSREFRGIATGCGSALADVTARTPAFVRPTGAPA
jgi:hypothetical protein